MKSATKPEPTYRKELKAKSKLELMDILRRAVGLAKPVPRGLAYSYAIRGNADESEMLESSKSHELPLLRRAQMLL